MTGDVTSRTAGCVRRASSTSTGPNFSPPRLIVSFNRPLG